MNGPSMSPDPSNRQEKQAPVGFSLGCLGAGTAFAMVVSIIMAFAAMIPYDARGFVFADVSVLMFVTALLLLKRLLELAKSGNAIAIAAGTTVGAILSSIILLALVYPLIASGPPSRTTRAILLVRQSATALTLYCSDNQDKLPSSHWVDVGESYASKAEFFKLGPTADSPEKDAYFHAFNSHVEGMAVSKVESPEQTVMTFSSESRGRNAQDPLETLRSKGLVNGLNFVTRVDGSAKRVRAGRKIGHSTLNGPYDGDPYAEP